MTKILFIMESLQLNGASKSLLALLNAICENYEVELFLFSADGALIDEIPQNVHLLPEIAEYRLLCQKMKDAVKEALAHGNIGLAWFRFRVFLERAMKRPFTQWEKLPKIKGDWDVVCGYSDGFVASVVMNKSICAKKILWIHENYEDNTKSVEILASIRKANAIVGVSKDATEHIKKILGNDFKGETYIIHNIVDAEAVRIASGHKIVKLQEGSKNIISVGRLSYEKGYDMIPRILVKLENLGIKAHWSIVGNGLKTIRETIINQARQLGVERRIHFIGAKNNPHPYVKAADCFVQLSRHEGWCLTITEALAIGVPVVVSDLQVFHEQVFEGYNGFFAQDVETFAKAIYQVLSGKNKLKHKGLEINPCSPKNVKLEFSAMLRGVCQDSL